MRKNKVAPTACDTLHAHSSYNQIAHVHRTPVAVEQPLVLRVGGKVHGLATLCGRHGRIQGFFSAVMLLVMQNAGRDAMTP